MDKVFKYYAFGLNIQSFVQIPQIPKGDFSEPDVTIVAADFSSLPKSERKLTSENSVFFRVVEAGRFRITNGNMIQVELAEDCKESVLAVYLMGSCMGAILIQRGYMLLHGSCVTNGKRSILITGDSGAGKSTLAAEFLKNGWKLLTDDVTCLYDIAGTPTVQSSYPSQKLWQDAMDRYGKSGEDVHALYFSEDREKFGVNVADSFLEGTAPLSMVVRLMPNGHSTLVSPIEGMAKVDQLMRNTYRYYMLEQQHQQRHFQRCVTLSTKLPMALAVRENNKDCAPVLYDMITKFMEENCHD